MIVKAITLYQNGRLNSKEKQKKIKFKNGSLDLNVTQNPVTGRMTYNVDFLDKEGRNIFNPIHDVVCVSISADGLHLRGIEYNFGREVSQEWYCIPIL